MLHRKGRRRLDAEIPDIRRRPTVRWLSPEAIPTAEAIEGRDQLAFILFSSHVRSYLDACLYALTRMLKHGLGGLSTAQQVWCYTC